LALLFRGYSSLVETRAQVFALAFSFQTHPLLFIVYTSAECCCSQRLADCLRVVLFLYGFGLAFEVDFGIAAF
jgi:hypothetical protein